MSALDLNIMDAEINHIVKNLRKLGKTFDEKELRKISIKAAKPIVKAARAKIKDSNRPHHRYYKGGGLAATYMPGNLRRSIGVLRLKNTPEVYVGPRATKGKKNGTYSGGRVDGWYAHFIEYGVPHRAPIPFMRTAFDETKLVVVGILSRGAQRLFDSYQPN